MKVLQSIWDASAVATVARGDLRFLAATVSRMSDLSKLAELRTLKGHSRPSLPYAVFPDGRRVVSASADNTLVAAWRQGVKCGMSKVLQSVNCVAIFPDRRRVVSASWDSTLKVWDVGPANAWRRWKVTQRVRAIVWVARRLTRRSRSGT